MHSIKDNISGFKKFLKSLFFVCLLVISGSFVFADENTEQTAIVVPLLSSVFQSTGNSIYNITLADSSDYNFCTSTFDIQNGGKIQKFYNVYLNVDGLVKSGDVQYTVLNQKDDNTIFLQWFNHPIFLKYEISDSVSSVKNVIEITSDDVSISEVLTGALSGVINNTKVNLSIESEFLNNFSKTGASSINNNKNAMISSIKSTFIGNYSLDDGGVINNKGNIVLLNSVFLGNYSNQNGVIYNTGTIDRINSEFIGNYALLGGGAIYNDGTISEINSNFISNYSDNDGGAIYNAQDGVITNIISTFVSNFSKGDGGAIYNLGEIGTIENSSFLGNYTSVVAKRGGAIYSETDLNFLANGATIEFTGNYVLTESGKLNEAIYINDSESTDDVTLTFSIKDGGTVVLNDSISGADLINVVIQGENASNDTFKLFNQINNAAVTFQNVKLDVLDGNIADYNFEKTTFKDEVLFDFDITLDESGNLLADTITTDKSSRGVLTLNKMNLLGVDLKTILENQLAVKIINSTSSRIILGISSALENEIAALIDKLNLPSEVVSTMTGDTDIKADAKWSDDFGEVTHIYGERRQYLGVTDDKKSFGFIYKYNTNEEVLTDVLAILNKAIIKNDLGDVIAKSFTTDTSYVYTVGQDLGETQGELTIKGYSSNNSAIDLNGHTGFELISSSVLNLKNVKIYDSTDSITNPIVVKNHQAVLNLQDVYLSGNIIGLGLNDNRFTINITGDDVTTITGIIKDANVNLKGGRFRFDTDTFADSSVTLKTDGGVIDLADNSIKQYNIAELISSKAVDYEMDMKLGNLLGETSLTSDSLRVGRYSLGGAVKIHYINFIDELASLKLNNKVIDAVNNIGITAIMPNDIKKASDVLNSDFVSEIKSKYSDAADLFSKSTTVLYSDYVGAEGSQNILLELADDFNNLEVYVTSAYHKIDTFDKYLVDGNFIINSNNEMFDNVYVTAFYRDVLVNNSGKGLDYLIKYLEVQDKVSSKSIGDLLQLTLEYQIQNSETRIFNLVKDYTLTNNSDSASINVSAGKVEITSQNNNNVLDFKNREIVLNNSTDLKLSDLNTSNINLKISSSDANVTLKDVYFNGSVSSDIEGAKIVVTGDKTTTMDAYINNGVTVQLGGSGQDERFAGVFNIKAGEINGDKSRFNLNVGTNSVGVIDLGNGTNDTYKFSSLVIDDGSKTTFSLDVNLNENVFENSITPMIDLINAGSSEPLNFNLVRNLIFSDKISTDNGQGIVTISNVNVDTSLASLVNFIAGGLKIDKTAIKPAFYFDVEIIQGNNDLTLALDDTLNGVGTRYKFKTTSVGGDIDNIKVDKVTSWSQSFAFVTTDWYYKLSINDNNGLHFDITSDMAEQRQLEALYFVNRDKTNVDKIFAASDTNTHYVNLDSIDLDITGTVHPKSVGITKGNLTISGLIETDLQGNEARSTLDFQHKYGGMTVAEEHLVEEVVDGETTFVHKPQTVLFDSVHLTKANASSDDTVNLGNGSLLNVLANDATVILRDVVVDHNNSDGLGGAIYSKSDVSIYADNADSVFDGNRHNLAEGNSKEVSNDLYFAKNYDEYGEQNLYLNAKTDKTIAIRSGIDFDKDTKLVLNVNNEDGYDGTVYIRNDVGSAEKSLANINLNGGTLSVSNDSSNKPEFSTIYTDNLTILKDTYYTFDIDVDGNGQVKNDKIVIADKRLTPTEIFNDKVSLGYTGLILTKDLMNINLKSSLPTKIQVIDMIGETKKFIKLTYETDGETKHLDNYNTGLRLNNNLGDGYNYYVRLGLNGNLIIYNDNPNLNNNSKDLLNIIDKYSTKSLTYNLNVDKVIYDYGNNTEPDGLNIVTRHKELKSAKLTINGNTNSTISTLTSVEGITLAGVLSSNTKGKVKFSIAPNKQQLVGKNFSMKGFDGAIINKGGKVTLTSVNFEDNETEDNGAGINNKIYTIGTLRYKGSVSLKGTSKNYAKLYSNVATYDGGAIYNESSLTLKYVELGNGEENGNRALNGGAVANIQTAYYPTSTNISYSRFYNNIADEKGGAIYTTGLMKSSKNSFDSNVAKNGGAVYVNADNNKNSAVTITSDTFTSNSADEFGGALFVDKGSVNVSKSTFGTAKYDTTKDEKIETGNSAEKGGAIYVKSDDDVSKISSKNSSKVSISSSKFYNNTAVDGGVIYNDENSNLSLSKNTFGGGVTATEKVNGKNKKVTRYYYNETTGNGGAIYNKGNLTDSKSSYGYNKAENGGAIYNDNRIVGIKTDKKGKKSDIAGLVSIKLNSNTANENGGAILNTANGYVWSNKSSFTGNYSKLGGAIYNDSSADIEEFEVTRGNSNIIDYESKVVSKLGIIKADSTTFKQNYADNGGAIYNKGSLILNKSTFTQNGVYAKVLTEDVEITITDSDGNEIIKTITRPTGEVQNSFGGAIYNNGFNYENGLSTEDIIAVATITSSTFVGNYAKSDIYDSENFGHYEAKGYGGAIYNGELGIISINKSTFGKNNTKTVINSNSADFGGAIYNSGNLTTTGSS
ncbi:MAG TPA: hypothetical protein DEF63_07880, partial [Cyanobacteria bacterium UBA11440]|nr:hypothetical protein [Cyanobacteria bacterium UBA11440]